jgi:mono/diheme cytochrome c family protein
MLNRNCIRTALAAILLSGAANAPALAQDQSGSVGVLAPVAKTGEETYQYICQSCHMADGKGGSGAGAIPSLAANPKLAQSAYVIVTLMNGRGAMPGFKGALTPAQSAEIVTYIRTHFGNKYAAPVSAAEVSRLSPP